MRRYGAESKSIAITIFVNILLVALVLDVKSVYNKVTHELTKVFSKLLRVLKLEATCFDGLEATSSSRFIFVSTAYGPTARHSPSRSALQGGVLSPTLFYLVLVKLATTPPQVANSLLLPRDICMWAFSVTPRQER